MRIDHDFLIAHRRAAKGVWFVFPADFQKTVKTVNKRLKNGAKTVGKRFVNGSKTVRKPPAPCCEKVSPRRTIRTMKTRADTERITATTNNE
jgi:hypothetical protein